MIAIEVLSGTYNTTTATLKCLLAAAKLRMPLFLFRISFFYVVLGFTNINILKNR